MPFPEYKQRSLTAEVVTMQPENSQGVLLLEKVELTWKPKQI